jgi:hypothetical protein
MRFSTFVKHGELIELRLQAINKQVLAISELSVIGDLTSQQTNKLKLLSHSAAQKHTEFEKQLNKLFSTIPALDDIDTDKIGELQDKISDLFISTQSICDSLLPAPQPEQALNDSNVSGTQSTEVKQTVRLPKLNLPTFSGQPEHWVAFQGIFENTVHKNGSISNIEKFSYLLSCLSDEPLNLVKSLPLNSANYFLAWDKLLKRYHNTRQLITLHTSNILDLPQLSKPTVKQLRDFISVYNDNYQALKALNHDIAANENLILTLHLLRKFDSNLRSEFERKREDSKIMPTISEFIKFLEDECSQREAAHLNNHTSSPVATLPKLNSQKGSQSSKSNVGLSKNNLAKPSKQYVMSVTTNKPQTCVYCNSAHSIFQCESFCSLTPQDRYTAIKEKNLCLNCFGSHKTGSCKSLNSCKKCMKRHHTLLHFQREQKQVVTSDVTPSTCSTSTSQALDTPKPDTVAGDALVATSCSSGSMVLLATALVNISTENGNQIVVRAILDSASQTTIISEYCASTLKVMRSHASVPEITGISSAHIKPKGLTSVNLSSLGGSILATAHPVLILDKISGDMPRTQLSPNVRAHLKGYTLADPSFDAPGPIDALIGADLFTQTLVGPTVALGDKMPYAINTIFGYVILGNAPVLQNLSQYSGLTTLLSINDIDLHSMLQRFWQIEEPPQCSKLSPEEQECETHFVNTHSRDSSGRFVCRLPFKDDPRKLGESSNIAKSTFLSTERKFESNPELKRSYVDFMEDYLSSGHMRLSDETSFISEPHCFLPHHSVFKDGKIRVVFNASSPTTSGLSLNNILHQGPKLHNEIRDIILRFRFYKIAFTCDIKQMFRMISIHANDQPFQLIYWRNHPSHPLKTYQLTTVTFGMTSSPFLANRVVRELIEKEEENYPHTSKILQQQIYVDDALLGADSIQEALTLRNEVIALLQKGGFELRKWNSNDKRIFDGLPTEHCVTTVSLDQNSVGILGLKWNPESDYFSYSIEKPTTTFTKRSVLSTIARIYDVTGMLAPLTLWAKALMQHVWALGLEWDAYLPSEIASRWSTFIEELHLIEDLKIPRYLALDNAVNIQLHGFSDASELGYAACVYVRTEDAQGNVMVNLLIAKSKVAPLKRITIPRLELCGAHILANLINYCVVQLSDKFHIDTITAWSDSTIALSWIHTPAYRLKLYVANRVAQIQELTPSCIWKHVSTHDNPADVASRGLTPANIKNNSLWWFGPHWLQSPPSSWPPSRFSILEEDLPESKPTSINLLSTEKPVRPDFEFVSNPKYSSWKSLLHIMGYVLRFITCIKKKSKISQSFTREELEESEKRICWIVQAETFPQEIDLLKKNKPCSKRFQRLSPFIDDCGIVRVGGRLKQSNLAYANKHQIILPKNHAVVNLLIDHYHKMNLHAGPQQLQALLQEKFWILNARSAIRSRVFKCVKCFRVKPKLTAPLMGDLPADRVIPSRCFNISAMDYAGPFTIKFFRLRGAQPLKVYICLFICLATKAIHLEVVSDLTSEAFISCLTRFISRRGLVSDLYSDCGTNFVGAASSLKKCFENLMRSPSTQQFAENHRVKFHFIPPHAPHQGGLWERAVKSMKYHLTRVMGEQILTYEEFLTLTVRIEAILNSRPITPLSADPNDLQPITPGHFLTGGPLTSLIEPHLLDSSGHLQRWRLIQSFTQHFWSRWQKEYLQTLQERSKWTSCTTNLQVGDLVIIHEDNSPPLAWKMGRITEVFPGRDGIVRVVQLKTTKGTLTRPAIKVFRLPIHN